MLLLSSNLGSSPLYEVRKEAYTNTPRVVLYCPDEALSLCDAICSLRGILEKSRISGFTLEYTEMLLRAMFADGDDDPDYSPAKDCAWPPVPVPTPYESFDCSLNNASTSPRSPSQFELPFTPTSSFAQDVEDEMLKYESSIYSEKTNILAENRSITEEHVLKSGTTSTLADHVQKYQECVGTIAGSEKSNWSSPRIRFSDADSDRHLLAAPSMIDSQCATPKSSNEIKRTNKKASQIGFFDNDSRKHLLAATPTVDPRCPTPKSPNAMNRMNEQDPAFVRSLDDEPKTVKKLRPKSMIPSPMRKKEDADGSRSQTSMGLYPRSEGTVRRYLSFVKKLRGRVE